MFVILSVLKWHSVYFLVWQIALGTVTNVDEAVEWLSYTYLYIRMRVNPLVYGIPYGAKEVCL